MLTIGCFDSHLVLRHWQNRKERRVFGDAWPRTSGRYFCMDLSEERDVMARAMSLQKVNLQACSGWLLNERGDEAVIDFWTWPSEVCTWHSMYFAM